MALPGSRREKGGKGGEGAPRSSSQWMPQFAVASRAHIAISFLVSGRKAGRAMKQQLISMPRIKIDCWVQGPLVRYL